MKKLNYKKWVAVFAALAVVAYLFFSGPLVSLFSSNEQNLANEQLPETGVQTQDLIIGSGLVATSGDMLTAHYIGTLANGRVFDSSYDRNTPITFTLGVGEVIRGWDEGLLGMREGGKRVLKIAPDYGYGAQAVGAIPANSPLIFEVELLDVEKSQ
ncbi:MAG: FKBP-type peptidyl-prolyl cis-trans isomerase [Candidatus Zambryskibacteria bacterium]|nr:FKBP-type peptidyl-prolyl cis-trans isomerase [Candidatus Zambryskibacteria bacterium]